MNFPERQQLPSSILHHSLMFKIVAFSLFNKTELYQGKAAKSVVPNAGNGLKALMYCRTQGLISRPPDN